MCVNDLGYMTKMAAMPIYGKTFGAGGPISTKRHVAIGLLPIIVHINHKFGLTLTYFTTRSNYVAWTFRWETYKESLVACDLKIDRHRQLT